jgi:hypothetical protein
MKTGHRLSHNGKTVARGNVVTDGPYGETKEAVGGYWFIIARSLEEAVSYMQQSPCLACGLFYEIRQLEYACASAYEPATETPDQRRGS